MNAHVEPSKLGDNPEFDKALSRVDLSGDPLTLKLVVIARANELYFDLRAPGGRLGRSTLSQLRRAGRRGHRRGVRAAHEDFASVNAQKAGQESGDYVQEAQRVSGTGHRPSQAFMMESTSGR